MELAIVSIKCRVQVGRLFCLRFMFTWSEAPTVTSPLQQKADDSIQPENRQLYASLRLVLPPRGYLSVAPPLPCAAANRRLVLIVDTVNSARLID